MAGLPPGWEWDYDGQRWFYTYKPTGHIQYHFPKEGDEFPDFVDAGAPAPSLAPEELLASQQQVKRQTSSGSGTGGRPKARVSATATRPVSNVWEEASGEDAIFQPESLMYLGPGTYNDVSPLAEEEDEAARRVITGALAEAEGTPTSASKGPSPIASQGATPATKKSDVEPPKTDSAVHIVDAGPVIEVQSGTEAELAVPMLDSREMPHELPVEVFNPVGVIAEMATEMTQRAQIETNPPPVEIADNSILAPIETILPPQGYSELPGQTSPVENKKSNEPGGISIEIPKSKGAGTPPVQIQQPPPPPPPQQQQQQRQKQQEPSPPPPLESPPVDKQPEGPSSKYQAFSPANGSTEATEKMENTRRSSMALDPRRISMQREPSLLMGLGKNNNKMDPSLVPAALSLSKPTGPSPERSPPFRPVSCAAVESIDVVKPSDNTPSISPGPSALRPARNGDGRKLSDSTNPTSPIDDEFERTMQLALGDKPGVSKVPSVLKPARGRAPSMPGTAASNSQDGSRNQSPAQTTPRRSYEQDEAGPVEKKYLPYTGINSGYRMSYVPPPPGPPRPPPQQFGTSPSPLGPQQQPPQNPGVFHQGHGPIQHQPSFPQGAVPPHMTNMPRPASTPVGPIQPPAGAPPMQPQQSPSNYPHAAPPQGPPRTVASRRSMSIGAAEVSPIQQSETQSPQVPMQTPSPMEHMRRVSSVSLADGAAIFTPSPDTGSSAAQSQPGTRPPSSLRNFSSPPQDGASQSGPPRPGKVPIDQGSYFPPQPTPRENFQPQPPSKRMSMPPGYSIDDSGLDWTQGAGKAPVQSSPPVPAKVPENPTQGLHRSHSVGSSSASNVQPPRRLEPGRMGPVQQHGAGFILSMIEEHHEPPPSRHGPPGHPNTLQQRHEGFGAAPTYALGPGQPPPPNDPPTGLPPYPLSPPQQYQQPVRQAPYPVDNVPPVADRVDVPPHPSATSPAQLPPPRHMSPLGQGLPSRHESLRRHVPPQAQMQAAQNQAPLQRHTSLRESGSQTSHVVAPVQPFSTHQGPVHGQPPITHSSPHAPGFQRQGSLRGPKPPRQSQPAPHHLPPSAPHGRPQTPPESPQAQGQMPQVSPLNLGNPQQGPMPPHEQKHLQGQVPHGQAPQGQMLPPQGYPTQGKIQPHGQLPPQALTPQNQHPHHGQALQGQMPPPGHIPPHGQMAQMHISPQGHPVQGQPPFGASTSPHAQFYSPGQIRPSHARTASKPDVFMSPGGQTPGFSPNPQQGSPGFQPSKGRPGANSPQPGQGPSPKEKDRKWTKWFKSSKSGPQIKHMHIQHIPNPPGPQSQGLQSPLNFGPNPNQSAQASGYQLGNVPVIKQDYLPSQPTAAPLLTPSASPSTNTMTSNRASTDSQGPQKSPSLAPQAHQQGRQSPSFQLHPGTPLGSHPPNGPGYRSPELRPKDSTGSPKSSIASLRSSQRAEPPQAEATTLPAPIMPIPTPSAAAQTAPAPAAPSAPAPSMRAPIVPTQGVPAPKASTPNIPTQILAAPTVYAPTAPAPLTPQPLAPIPKRDDGPLAQAPRSAPLPGAQTASGEKKDKWTKTPAVDYTGDDWGSEDEWN